jgi:hypothetical protein
MVESVAEASMLQSAAEVQHPLTLTPTPNPDPPTPNPKPQP